MQVKPARFELLFGVAAQAMKFVGSPWSIAKLNENQLKMDNFREIIFG
jgi:hypothetical protein